MAFSQRLPEVSHQFTCGPLNFSPEASMSELWALIKQKVSLSSRKTSRKIFHIATNEIKLMHWDTSQAVSWMEKAVQKDQAILYRAENEPDSCNKI